jgi:hypothetical protein
MKRPLFNCLRYVVLGYFLFGVAILAALWFSAPLELKQGDLGRVIASMEQIDFRPFLFYLFGSVWLLPIVAVAFVIKLRPWGQRLLVRLLEVHKNRTIPVAVQIKQHLPIEFDQMLRIPLDFRTHIDIEKEANIQTEVPVQTQLEIDTMVQTKVLGIGNINIPIRTKIPIDMVIPVSSVVQVEIRDLPIVINDNIELRLPKLDVPVDTKLQAKVELLSLLER